MRAAFTFILILILSVPAYSLDDTDSTGVYWVFFEDKGPDIESRIAEFEKSLPEKTIERRRKALDTEVVADILDLPVFEPYIDSLESLVIRIRQQSRWLNAVSAVISLSKIDNIRSFSFVTEMEPVRRSDPMSIETEISETWIAGEHGYFNPTTSLDYGRSFDQLEQIGVVWAHEEGFHGEGVLICFLDTGFLTYHHAFNHMDIVAEYDFINDDDFVGFDPDQDLPGQPDHGTGCLGTIGGFYPGELIGPAFAASFILCKTEETGSETAVEEDYYVAGLEWGEIMGADVASSSLSYSDWYTADDLDGETAITTRAANIAFEKGMILCSSMGNSGPGKFTLGAPADSRLSLGIGGVQWNGELYRWSSWGPTADGRIKPDVSARAVKTVAATPYTTDGFGLWNGTSLSCPLVAGAVALVIQAHPDWSPEQVKEAVRESANRATRPDIRFGWGVVNVKGAINYPSLGGYVSDSATGRLVIAEVEIENLETGEFLNMETDDSGYYLFPNLEFGHYNFRIFEEKYLPFEKIFTIPPSEEFDVFLQPVDRN
ncbi:MAG: S8 family serine peptidase [candidate division Zixibacteria bacterium]